VEPGHHGFGHASRAAKRVYALRAREPFSAKMTLLRGFPPRKDHDAAHIASLRGFPRSDGCGSSSSPPPPAGVVGRLHPSQ